MFYQSLSDNKNAPLRNGIANRSNGRRFDAGVTGNLPFEKEEIMTVIKLND